MRYGIADIQGVESYRPFIEDTKKEVALSIERADNNPRRQAVMFVVIVSEKVDADVTALMKRKEWMQALKRIKEGAKDVRFPQCRFKRYSNRWKKIGV